MSGNSNALFIYLFIQMQEVRRKEEAAARGKLHFLYLYFSIMIQLFIWLSIPF
jgi:hypothetical protein